MRGSNSEGRGGGEMRGGEGADEKGEEEQVTLPNDPAPCLQATAHRVVVDLCVGGDGACVHTPHSHVYAPVHIHTCHLAYA
jgi:hypothetical protein